jgi:heat shock protein HslJ
LLLTVPGDEEDSMTHRERARFAGGALVVGCALGLGSCGEGVTGPSALQGTPWQLESMEIAGGTFEPDDPSRFTVEFDADGTIGIRADCNQCGGTYVLNGDRLTAGPLACTLVACPTPRGQQFAGLLDGTSSVDIDDDELEIESSEGKLVLTR